MTYRRARSNKSLLKIFAGRYSLAPMSTALFPSCFWFSETSTTNGTPLAQISANLVKPASPAPDRSQSTAFHLAESNCETIVWESAGLRTEKEQSSDSCNIRRTFFSIEEFSLIHKI